MSKSIPVFYRPEQVAPRQGGSPSAQKPEEVVASWQKQNLPIELHSFEAATLDDLCRAHDPKYVRAVLSCTTHNGFGTKSPEAARSFPYTSGSFLAAARHVWEHGGVACSPTSGFHHAEYDQGGGFCTFNGLMVAATDLLQRGAKAVGVMDLDAHYGNGTDDIIHTLKLNKRVYNYTHGCHGYTDTDDGSTFLATLPVVLKAWVKVGVEVVLFQAGADPHMNDPLGGMFTSSEMRERDRIVFQTCKRLGLPVAWNLAGGYQERPAETFAERIRPVLDIHDATMQECAKLYAA